MHKNKVDFEIVKNNLEAAKIKNINKLNKDREYYGEDQKEL